jgi:putative DNA primase/helicase
MIDFDRMLHDAGILAINDVNDSEAVIGAALSRVSDAARHLGAGDRELLASAIKRRFTQQRVRGYSRFVDLALRDGASRTRTQNRADDAFQSMVRAVEPWGEPVDGATLLNEAVRVVQTFVCLSVEGATAAALWIVHTYAIDAAETTPRLAITSPTRRCGKTTMCALLNALVHRPLATSNMTASVLFRLIEHLHPTFVIDEADSFLSIQEEMRNVLNSGHERDGAVFRCEGEDNVPTRFGTWGAIAIAAIGDLPPTVADRSIRIRMSRKGKNDHVEPLRRRTKASLEPLARRCARWATDNMAALTNAEPEIPEDLHDRAADNWEPLLAIADACGGDWPRRARATAVILEQRSEDAAAPTDLSEVLLADITEQLRSGTLREPVFMTDIVDRLVRLDDRPWRTSQRDRPLDTYQLGRLLRPYGVRAQTVRRGAACQKGYPEGAFNDAIRRYLPPPAVTSVTPAESRPKAQPARGTAATARGRGKPNGSANVTRVTGVTGNNGAPRRRR